MVSDAEQKMAPDLVDLSPAPFVYNSATSHRIDELDQRVREMRRVGRLSPEVLHHISKYFRVKSIYHSNAIEGNQLDIGETRLVVEEGLTIAGKPLKDQAEAKNLNAALDFLEELASDTSQPISLHDIRQIHNLILQGIDDDNAGAYRTIDVAISGSDYRPPDPIKVGPEMQDLMEWLTQATSTQDFAVVPTAAAFHAWFAQIHPFVDGNGRTARILMNLLLMRAGYPIAVITREDRTRYIEALEESQASDLTPFIALLIETIEETLEEYEAAAEEQQAQTEQVASLARRFSQADHVRASNEYEVWRSAMDLLLNHYRQVVQNVNDNLSIGQWDLKEFDMLPFEKYLPLRGGQSAKQTWFFRVDFKSEQKEVRYLYFFGFSSYAMSNYKPNAKVSLHLAREGSPFYFDKLDGISTGDVPLLREIAYSPSDETFVVRHGSEQCMEQKIEQIANQFFESVVSLQF